MFGMKPGQETKAKCDESGELIHLTIAGVPGLIGVSTDNAKSIVTELQAAIVEASSNRLKPASPKKQLLSIW